MALREDRLNVRQIGVEPGLRDEHADLMKSQRMRAAIFFVVVDQRPDRIGHDLHLAPDSRTGEKADALVIRKRPRWCKGRFRLAAQDALLHARQQRTPRRILEMRVEIAVGQFIEQSDVFTAGLTPLPQRGVFAADVETEGVLDAIERITDLMSAADKAIADDGIGALDILPEFKARIERVDVQIGDLTEFRENAGELGPGVGKPKDMQRRGNHGGELLRRDSSQS